MIDRTLRPVVVGIDGRSESRTALRYAVDEARNRGRPLRVVRAREPVLAMVGGGDGKGGVGAQASVQAVGQVSALVSGQPGEPADPSPEAADLDAALAVAGDQLERDAVSGVVVNGAAASAVLEQAEGAELVVVGSRSRSAVASVVMGSVNSAVAQHARCPVIVVRASKEHAPAGRRIVVGTDGSHHAERAVAFAFEEASLRGLPLSVVHCWRIDAPDEAQWDTDAFASRRADHVRWVGESLAGLRVKYPDVDVATNVLEGRPGVILTEFSRGADLVVVGARGLGGIERLLLGSVGQTLLHHAHCSVAVVRAVHR
ncbi:universal stress protein [Actinopolymorpha pittospori]